MVGGVEGKNRDKSQRPMILRKIKDKTVSLELVNYSVLGIRDDSTSEIIIKVKQRKAAHCCILYTDCTAV